MALPDIPVHGFLVVEGIGQRGVRLPQSEVGVMPLDFLCLPAMGAVVERKGAHLAGYRR